MSQMMMKTALMPSSLFSKSHSSQGGKFSLSVLRRLRENSARKNFKIMINETRNLEVGQSLEHWILLSTGPQIVPSKKQAQKPKNGKCFLSYLKMLVKMFMF